MKCYALCCTLQLPEILADVLLHSSREFSYSQVDFVAVTIF